MSKKMLERFSFTIVGVLFALFCVFFKNVKDFYDKSELFVFIGSFLMYSIPIPTAFCLYWHQKNVDKKERFHTALKSAVFSLQAQFESSINMLCSTVNQWFNGETIIIQKFSHDVGNLQRINKDLICGASDLPIEKIQGIFILEENLVWIYSSMTNINLMIDLLNNSDEKNKDSIHKELVEQVRSVIDHAIKYSEEFMDVMDSVVEEMNKSGVKIKSSSKGINALISKSEATRMFLNKVGLRPRGGAVSDPGVSVTFDGSRFIVKNNDRSVFVYGISDIVGSKYNEFFTLVNASTVGVATFIEVEKIIIELLVKYIRMSTVKGAAGDADGVIAPVSSEGGADGA